MNEHGGLSESGGDSAKGTVHAPQIQCDVSGAVGRVLLWRGNFCSAGYKTLGEKAAAIPEHEDFPVRLLFISSQELYDIVYVDTGSLKLVNGLYREGRRPAESHIVVLEDGNLIGQVQIPGAIGYCVVKEGGVVEYYRKK